MWDAVRIAITPVALVVGALVGSKRFRLDPRSDLGLRLPSLRHALILSAAFVVLMTVEEIALRSFNADGPADWRSRYSTGALLLRVVFAGVVYPLAEECFFRGFLLAIIRRKAGAIAAIAATAIFFTALHGLANPSLGTLQILADGIFFAYVRLRSGSLLLPAACHVAGNTLAVMQRL